MAERFKAHAWKACKGATLSRVQIPLSPPSNKPDFKRLIWIFLFILKIIFQQFFKKWYNFFP